ncbi:hypothetical protein D1872_215520 [compost metagenome]
MNVEVEASRLIWPSPIDFMKCPTTPVSEDSSTFSIPTSTMTEIKCGRYTVVCMSCFIFLRRIWFKMSARTMGAGKPSTMLARLIIKVFRIKSVNR